MSIISKFWDNLPFFRKAKLPKIEEEKIILEIFKLQQVYGFLPKEHFKLGNGAQFKLIWNTDLSCGAKS